MIDADTAADLAALERLTLWALSQYSPVVAMDPPDGIVMDTEGADHLQGGEDLMLSGLVNRFRGRGLAARAAIADTWGAAHALARTTDRETVIVGRGDAARAANRLPLSSLRLPAETVQSLRTLGFATVGDLAATPRAPLTLRFGPEVGRRLDQMFGHIAGRSIRSGRGTCRGTRIFRRAHRRAGNDREICEPPRAAALSRAREARAWGQTRRPHRSSRRQHHSSTEGGNGEAGP